MTKPKLLIIDDDAEIRSQMKWAFAKDYEVFIAEDRQSALATFRAEHPAVMTLDLGLPPSPRGVEEGLHTLSAILQEDASAKVIVITGREEHEHALTAIGEGAYDFFRKPIQVDELKVIIQRALYVYQLEREHRALQQRLSHETYGEMLGASPQIQEVFATIRRVATSDAPVLITGESGTGKELVARAIHQHSSRSKGPFHVINCGAIPEHLLESELFGHEKGAFTGAHAQRKGRIELAQGGTLVLDEIGDFPLALQVKLLRFLQQHEIERIGGRQTLTVDARVLAATNKDLQQAMRDGLFREDLYFRLAVVNIALPPLRARGGDIGLLANTLLQRYGAEQQKKVLGFTRQALSAIQHYHWPGNVRELENRIKRAVIMAEGPRITPEDLELTTSTSVPEGRTLKEAREALEKDLIQRTLSKNKGNITRTAVELGVSRPTLHELLSRYNITR
ncbi:MAG: PEP-CTERM-box response regulator transcription factor [Candidatus Tectimicrobiota bacterium]